jgi:quinol monooxygenase YgiN
MSVVIVADVHCRPGARDQFVAAIRGLVVDTRQQPGFEDLDITFEDGDDDLVVMVERWTTADDYHRYLEWRAVRGDRALLYGLMTGPPTFRYLNVTPTEVFE